MLAIEVARSLLNSGKRRLADGLPGRLGQHLDLAGALELPHSGPRLSDGTAKGEQAMVAQDHRVRAAEVGYEPLALVRVESHPPNSW